MTAPVTTATTAEPSADFLNGSIGDSVRISVAILSYVDTVSFGVTADYDSSADLDVFTKGIQHGLAELTSPALAS
jgi:hypothetical protein